MASEAISVVIRHDVWVSRCKLSLSCARCGKNTQHLNVSDATRLMAVSRSTLYAWMKQGVIHWRTLPGGHRFICQESLHGEPWSQPTE